jgi:hypothetical protein
LVISIAAKKNVIAAFCAQLVIARAAIEGVVTVTAHNAIVPATAG